MMKATRILSALALAVIAGACGNKVTHETGETRGDEAAGVELSVRSSVKGQIASNIVEITENIREMSQTVKDDTAMVTGRARQVAGQVSDIADGGVNAGVYLTPRASAQWEYKVITPEVEELESELNRLGEEGWELFSEREENGQTSYLLKRRRS
ncbi:MAG: hypothetical protein CMO66_05165 [Verrucomicrobiales bacterium]|nr:hypothetical protein [Verrucomicrobiales bacterium]MBR90647.1 hypothetical protein [Verrucomicrobiales bacterium]|tara:strand:+ start:1345 stop:1809 length:465 start_codon:yes stop_codon:yes gene_type:complete